jgi:hypothetical protein
MVFNCSATIFDPESHTRSSTYKRTVKPVKLPSEEWTTIGEDEPQRDLHKAKSLIYITSSPTKGDISSRTLSCRKSKGCDRLVLTKSTPSYVHTPTIFHISPPTETALQQNEADSEPEEADTESDLCSKRQMRQEVIYNDGPVHEEVEKGWQDDMEDLATIGRPGRRRRAS